MVGIQLEENFNRPYLSTTPAVFWTRWHMSLSFWIRDYLYVPLTTLRRNRWWHHMTLVIAMVIFGFWHDAKFTLWGGIVGEDGLQGIQLGDEFPGKAYRDFQRYLLYLKSKGILLAIASKNNPDDVFEVFDKHDAMILSRKDISVFEIHWESKVESIKRVAGKLNIGIDALVFVDDNPKEIGEVMERLPEVSCVMVPDELAHLPSLLADTEFFDLAEVTDEDRRRSEMMAVEVLRKQSQETMSEEEFRKSLGLKIEVFKVEKQHLTRVTQLINKTNQFNLTTIRRTQDEVEVLANSKDSLVLAMNIKDKYGDYGLVGAAILTKQNRTCVIDTLLMSCRVLGRGAEEALIAKITEAAKMLDCDELSGKYIPTPKNAMVKDLYSRFNFSRLGEKEEWILDIRTQIFDQFAQSATKATEQVRLFENRVGDYDTHLLPRSSGERKAR